MLLWIGVKEPGVPALMGLTECALCMLQALAKAESGGETETWVFYTETDKKRGYCNRKTMQGWIEGRRIKK